MKLRIPNIRSLVDHNPEGGTDFRAAGDKARGKGDWSEAAANYESHLGQKPDDFDIWVQLGHARKETGDYVGARAAYRRAIELRPEDFDVHLNMGHLEKLAGQQTAAISAYKTAFQLNPKNLDALREIVTLGGDVRDLVEENELAAKTIYFDMTDLIIYVQHNPSLSGIQRVCANLIEGIEAFSKLHENFNVVPVIPEYDRMRVFSVNRYLVLAMIETLHKGGAEIKQAVDAVYASRALVRPKKGDIFTIAGAFWIYDHYDLIQTLRENGVKFIIFIHDLIQISHPQYVHATANLVFRRALVDVLKLANGVLTNTEFVAGEVRRFMRQHMNFEIPVRSVFLATELPQPSATADVGDTVLEVLAEPYVLSVSTIEVRKNHLYMIKIWEKLIENKIDNIPNLVFVGKMGWDIDAFMEYLENSDHLGGRLKIVNGVTDGELAELYKHAMFTMFPSFVEGFGLPVGESLAYGKPVIASNSSSIPEVGGKFARYVDPENVYEGYVLVRDLITNPKKLAEWTSEIEAGYVAKTWRDFSIEYFEAVTAVSKSDDLPVNGAFEAGDVIGMGTAEVHRRDAMGLSQTYLASARRSGWHAVEPWGCWARSRRATLRLPTNLPPNADVSVYLGLQIPDEADPDNVTAKIEAGGRLCVVKPLRSKRQWAVADGKTEADGALSISILSVGRFGKVDSRELFFGLSGLAFCLRDDALTRVRILEEITLQFQA